MWVWGCVGVCVCVCTVGKPVAAIFEDIVHIYVTSTYAIIVNHRGLCTSVFVILHGKYDIYV